MGILTYKLLYILNAIVFLCLGVFFSLRWFISHRRKSEPFLVVLFTALSASYGLHAITYIFNSPTLFQRSIWIDFLIAICGIIFLSIMIGREDIFPFNVIYRFYLKIIIVTDKIKFRKNVKKVTKDKP